MKNNYINLSHFIIFIYFIIFLLPVIRKPLNININDSLNNLKQGIGYSFKFENVIFRPTKIDIQKKLLNLLG